MTASRLDAALRVIAATIGTLPLALFGAACIARFLPVSPDARYAIAFAGVIPLWVTAMCIAFLARRGSWALVVCIVVSVALATAVYTV